VHSELVALDLAEDWLFEIHATAGGEPAEAQYLDIARSCDLMVLIAGPQYSQATQDEYHEAFRDNPDKILPFYLGPGSDEVRDFRQLIDMRHSRVAVSQEEQLVEKAAESVERAVRNGRIIIRSLRESFEQRLEALENLLDLEPPRAFRPTLVVESETVDHSKALERSPRLAILEIGGAGKTYGAVVQLHRLSGVRRSRARDPTDRRQALLEVLIPLYLRASAAAVTVEALMERGFSAVRFYPGPELTAEFAREGRLALVVDGYDDLEATPRIELLSSIEEWANAYPRCRIMLLARSLPELALPEFMRVSPSPLEEEQLVEFFSAYGQPIRGMIDVPAELSELVVWPFWANAIARFGFEVTSGLELLQRMIAHRIAVDLPEARTQEKVRLAFGALAVNIYPEVSVAPVDALATLETWQQTPGVRARFNPEPAERLLEAMRASGLMDSEAEILVFVHPLFTATLAAEASMRSDPLPPSMDQNEELATFTAALLSENRAEELLNVLEGRDIFFLARVVRLSPPAERTTVLEADLDRYEKTLHRLAPLAGPEAIEALRQGAVAAAATDAWTAIRRVHGDVRLMGDDYDALLDLPGHEEAVIWEGTPFGNRMPERVAAAELLWRFKRDFNALTSTERFHAHHQPVPQPSDRDELAQLVLRRAQDLGKNERALRAEAGLDHSYALPRLDGQPHVTIVTKDHARFIEEEWGYPEAMVRYEEDPSVQPGFDSVPQFLAGPAPAAARARLRKRVEEQIGSALGSGAWNRPTALAGWVW